MVVFSLSKFQPHVHVGGTTLTFFAHVSSPVVSRRDSLLVLHQNTNMYFNTTTSRRLMVCAASEEDRDPPASNEQQVSRKNRRRTAESTDAIASALTRRFGIAGGLAWIGFLSAGVIGEQVKTRLEVAAEKSNTKDVSEAERVVETVPGYPGIQYYDVKRGGGARPRKGDLVVLHFKGFYTSPENGAEQVFVNTYETGKPIVFLYKSRPFTAGMCEGLEVALEDMRAGGKRHVSVPAQYAFENGVSIQATLHVPDKEGVVEPKMDVTYDVELVRVSIPPS